MYHDSDPKGSCMRETAQVIICQKYLRSLTDLDIEEIYRRIVKGRKHE